jgi:hypothetical protein
MPIAAEVSLGKNEKRYLSQKHYVWEKEEMNNTYFVIYKGENDTQYSITECNNSEVKQAFLSEGCVSGDETVLLRLSQMKSDNETIERFVEKNAGHLI